MLAIHPTETWMQVIVLTGLIGGGCAWQTGRAVALTWRPWSQVISFMLLLGLAVRFFHFALMGAPLLAPVAYVADTLFLLAVAATAWRYTRARQMARQYFWLYERAGPLSWRPRRPAAGERA